MYCSFKILELDVLNISPLVCTENKLPTPVILALGRQRKEQCESKAHVGYTVMVYLRLV